MSITFRNFQKSDVPAIVKIANMVEEQRNDPGRTTEERFNQLLTFSSIHAEDDFYIALDDKTIVGASLMIGRDGGMITADFMLHPHYKTEAVYTGFIERVEVRATHMAHTQLANEAVAFLLIIVHDGDDYLKSVLENFGYTEDRRQYFMRIALDKPFPKPTFPEKYEFRPFDKERDGRAVHAAFQESFADHWGNIAQMSYEQWGHQMQDPKFDPTLWFVLYEGDAIVAICLCEISGREEKLGIVEELGVRPAYRKQGLGGLLLRHAFHEFQQRGFEHVSLGVDAENTTNAVALYENAGMYVDRLIIAYRKILRGSAEAIKD